MGLSLWICCFDVNDCYFDVGLFRFGLVCFVLKVMVVVCCGFAIDLLDFVVVDVCVFGGLEVGLRCF